MAAIFSLLSVLLLILFVTRVAAVALMHTGLSREAARFQARSAFTGVGFTTGESEKVVNHPVRRRIVMLLMLAGHAGFITVISTTIATFISIDEQATWKFGSLFAGLLVIWLLSRSRWIDRRLSVLINRLLSRYTTIDVRDYASLLQLGGEYRVTELEVDQEDWLADRDLIDLRLREEGVMVLGINRRDGTFVGAPRGSTVIRPGDNLILYGKLGMCEGLDQRRRGREGEAQHRAAVAAQRRNLEQQDLQESSVSG